MITFMVGVIVGTMISSALAASYNRFQLMRPAWGVVGVLRWERQGR